MIKKVLYILLASVVLSACSKSSDYLPDRRTVLVYIAAANDLAVHAQANLTAMQQAYARIGRTPGRNLLVYYDIGEGVPRLMRLEEGGLVTLREYPGVNSTSAAQLERVVGDVLRAFPAESCGLILWSHATGWAPKDFPLATKNAFLSAMFPATRTFGHQWFEGQKCEMELDDLAAALPYRGFDFILTDACLMGGVETAYALRGKTEYLITYPTEVIAEGMPYGEITADLVSDAPAETLCRNICEKFFDYYDRKTGLYRSAAVTLVRTGALEALAASVRAVVKDNPAVAALPLEGIQHYDLYTRPFMYDLDDFIKQLADPDRYRTFRQALDGAVLYHAHTPTFFSLPLERCCGLSAYIPAEVYAAYHAPYYRTEWYEACYR